MDIIASDATKQLMTQLSRNRLKESLDGVPKQIDDVQARLAKATSAADKERYTELIRQLKAYQTEMKSYTLELPTITFAKSHVIKDPAGDLHIEFHGRAHTAGDIAVFSPQKRVVASGDVIIGFLPNIADGYPRPWPADDRFGRAARLRSHHPRTRAGPPRPRAHDANAELYRGADRAQSKRARKRASRLRNCRRRSRWRRSRPCRPTDTAAMSPRT